MGCNARLPASVHTHIGCFGCIIDAFTPTDNVLGSRGRLPHRRLLSTFYNANPGAQTGKILDVHVDQQGIESLERRPWSPPMCATRNVKLLLTRRNATQVNTSKHPQAG